MITKMGIPRQTRILLRLCLYTSLLAVIYCIPVIGQSTLSASEPTSIPKPDTEPTSEPTAESETTPKPKPETELTLEPMTESEATSEPKPETEPTSELIAESEPMSEPKPESEPVAESVPTSEPEPETEPTYEPTAESEPTSEAEAEPTSEPEPEIEPTLEPMAESESMSEPTSEPKPESELTSEPVAESEPTSEPTSEPKPETEPTYEPTAESEPTSEAEAEPTSEPEPEIEPTLEPMAESESMSEPTSEPKPESELTSEPVAESEPTSEPTSEPKPETEPTSEPMAESEPTSEPTSEPKPESELTSEPVAESEPTSEPEPEPTYEPLAESESTSEAEAESTSEPEPQSDFTSEPESEPTSDSDPESKTTFDLEPESKSTSENVAEEPFSELKSESEAGSEPVNESDPTSEPGAESESTSEAEAESEPTSESVSETEPYAEETPTPAEILLPPMLLIIVIVTSLLLLAGYTRQWRYLNPIKEIMRNLRLKLFTKHHVQPHFTIYTQHNETKETPPIAMTRRNDNTNCIKVKPMEQFLTEFDLEVMQALQLKHNTAHELIRIAFPALTSLALCPVTLFLFEPLTEFMWPKEQWPSRPDITDAIACYLSPAGLVYATSFGFAFQQALSKQHEILTTLIDEIGKIDHLATMTIKLSTLEINDRLKILKAVKCETIFMMMQILEREPSSFVSTPPEDVRVAIWSVVDILRKVDTRKENHINRLICKHILADIKSLNSICSDRISIMHTRIHPVMWMFLETLGFFSFLGILLLTAFSYKMELLMCIVTVFSISLLCYVVSDLDSPFSGFFRVDLTVFQDLINRLAVMFEMAKFGQLDVFYPEIKGLKSDVIG